MVAFRLAFELPALLAHRVFITITKSAVNQLEVMTHEVCLDTFANARKINFANSSISFTYLFISLFSSLSKKLKMLQFAKLIYFCSDFTVVCLCKAD